MKIIYISNSRIPTEKAHGFQIIKMCEAFSAAGAEIELWLPKRFNRIKENPFSYYGVKETFNIKKIPVIDIISLEKILGPIVSWIGSISFAILTFFYLSKNQAPGIIYSRDQFVSWFLSFLNRKFIYEIHSFPRNFRLHKRLWKKAYCIIAITQGLKNLLVKHGINSEKILVAPDGVDLEFFNSISPSKEDNRIELGLSPDDFLVGYVGRFKTLDMEKGIKTMISTLPLLDKETKMVFVGGEEFEIKEYKNMANRLNVFTQCLFVDHQPYLKVVKYMKAMDALIIPFPNTPHYAFYASPLKLFEYMAAGRPIIASDLPALREILNDKNALFFKPENTDDLARAVKMLKLSQTLEYHLSGQAFSDVKQYTWHNRAKNILKLIQ